MTVMLRRLLGVFLVFPFSIVKNIQVKVVLIIHVVHAIVERSNCVKLEWHWNCQKIDAPVTPFEPYSALRIPGIYNIEFIQILMYRDTTNLRIMLPEYGTPLP